MEYYVYVYMDPMVEYEDIFKIGLKFQPIYIGKGKKNRYYSHWNSILKNKKINNNLFNYRLCKIKEFNLQPIIIKIFQGLDDSAAKGIEKELISNIGRKILGDGPLLNISDGGDGGITWIGDNPFKGKTLEELYGNKKAEYMKRRLSEEASKKIREKNHMYGRRGEESPISGEKNGLYGKNHTKETRNRISSKLKEINSKLSKEHNDSIKEKIKETKSKWSEDKKNNIAKKISVSNSGRIFTEEHKNNLSNNNYNKKNKGIDKLKISDETKLKISNKLKNRKFSNEHKENLKIYKISYTDLKNIVRSENIKSKRLYKIWINQNNIDAPLNPEKIFICEWEGWNIFLNKIKK